MDWTTWTVYMLGSLGTFTMIVLYDTLQHRK